MWEILAKRYINLDPAYKGKTPRAVFEEMVKQRIPLGREQTPEDIGNVAVFLCSEAARNITGQSINVDGGWFMN
jgi:NAD(P)-dependent dehydrogenase (short-subunit alcohol dehydrogenase family)